MKLHETQKEFKKDDFSLLNNDLEPKPVHNRYTYLTKKLNAHVNNVEF